MRPKCPKCGGALSADLLWRRDAPVVHCTKCPWTRRVAQSEIIRLAVGEQYSRGYAAGHEDVMQARIRDAMEARRG